MSDERIVQFGGVFVELEEKKRRTELGSVSHGYCYSTKHDTHVQLVKFRHISIIILI